MPAPPVLSSLHLYPVKSLRGLTVQEAAVEPWGLAGDRRWMLTDREGRFITQRRHPELARIEAVPDAGGALRLAAPAAASLKVRPPHSPAAAGRTVPVRIWRDTVQAVPASAEADAWLSRLLGMEVRLVHLDDPAGRRPMDPAFAPEHGPRTVSFADALPVLLTGAASLAALNDLITETALISGEAAPAPVPMDRFRPNVVVAGAEAWAEDGWRRIRIGEVTFRVVKPCARCVVTTTDQRTGERGVEPLRTLGRHRRFGDNLLFGQNAVPEGTGVLRVGDRVTVLDAG